MGNRTHHAGSESQLGMQSIKACLDQLHDEASAHGITIAALLIGAASEAIADAISEKTEMTSDFVPPYAH